MGFGISLGGFDPVSYIKYDVLGKETPEEKAQKEAYEQNLEMWHLQNEYNTPANQVARLRAAGLNPNLFYDKGSTGNSTGVPTFNPVERQTPAQNILNLVSGIVGLQKELGDMKRSDRALDLQERAQDLDGLKFQSLLAHQKDAMDLERKKLMIDNAFRSKDYNLRKSKLEWEKSLNKGGLVGYFDKLMSSLLGKSTTDVATDAGNVLNYAFENLFHSLIVSPASVYNSIKSNSDLGSGMSKIRY